MPFGFAQGLQRAELIKAICGLKRHELYEEAWVPCDPLAFAAALDASFVTTADNLHGTVSVTDAEVRPTLMHQELQIRVTRGTTTVG